MTRVLIVDDQPLFRRQLRALLTLAGLDVVAEAEDIESAEAQVRLHHPDLAVVDVILPGVSGIEGAPRLKTLAPKMRLILVSAYRERVWEASAQAAGAEAFIPKDELDLSVVMSWKKAKEA